MSAFSGPEISSNGLVFYYDSGNTLKSWKGKPTTNIIEHSEDYSGGNFLSNWTGNLFNNWINSTVTTGFLDPLGTYTADKITGYYSRWTPSMTATPGETYTFSCWLKNDQLVNDPYLHIAFGLNGSLVAYNFVEIFSVSSILNWTRCSVTAVAPSSGINQIQCGVEFGASKSANATGYSVFVWGAQCEVGSFATPYIKSVGSSGVRSNTQAILDLTNNRTVTAQEVTYNSDGTFSFNNTANWCEISSLPAQTDSPLSVFAWVYLNATPTGTNGIWGHYGSSAVNCHFETYSTYTRVRLGNVNNSSLPVMATGTWVNVGFTSNGTAHKYYVNGIEQASWSGNTGTLFGSFTHMFGRSDVGRTWNGRINSLQVYLQQLSANEVTMNFTAQRGRYGL